MLCKNKRQISLKFIRRIQSKSWDFSRLAGGAARAGLLQRTKKKNRIIFSYTPAI
jgi:hypothetical protein